MSKAIDFDEVLRNTNDAYEASEAIMFFTNVICRIHRTAFIEGAYQICEVLAKGDELILREEPNSKIDEWDISVWVKKNGKEQKLGYIDKNLCRKIKTDKWTATVFEPFSLEDKKFGNFGMKILLHIMD